MATIQPPCILTIDDEKPVRTLFRQYLQRTGFDVIEADSGEAGLEIVRNVSPDLILVDLRMPGMDGLDVLASATRDSPQTPIIVVSGTGSISDAVEALRRGAWDYILKPIEDLAVLKHRIQGCLEKARLRRENETYQKRLKETLARISDDEEAGRKLQLRLLPPATSTVGGYLFSQRVIPSIYLSGDFVDYFAVDDDHIVFYAADVSGHGIPSALVTVLLKSLMAKYRESFRHRGDTTILQPAHLLERLNADLLHEDLENHFTIFCGVLTASRNTLTFANGGHFPHPILWNNGTARAIDERGIAVGVIPSATYHEVEQKLPDRFLMAIFSDGILEVMPQQNLPAKLEYLQSLRTREAVTQFVSGWECGEMLPDDITVLTISRSTGDE